MMNLRQQTVNVDRLKLIEALNAGLEKHRKQYAESKKDYEAAVILFLGEAHERAKNGVFKNLQLTLREPENHEETYRNVIEMLGVSVDETIQLDTEAYKAYYRNEWPWTKGFLESSLAFKAALGAAG